MIKKIIFLVVFTSIFSNFVTAKENILKYDTISFVQHESNYYSLYMNNKKNEASLFSTSSGNAKYTAYNIMYIVGSVNFFVLYFTYIFVAIVAPVALGVAFNAEGDTWIPLGAIIGTSWIPFFGPLVGAAMLGVMSDNRRMVPDAYKYRPLDFYGGFIAYCVLTAIFEVPFFVLMIIGYVGKRMIRGKRNVSMFMNKEQNGLTNIGISIKL